MENSQEHVSNWIESHRNKSILISKKEDGDLDQVDLQLDKVSLGQLKEKDPDEYLSMNTLLLHGAGSIQSGVHSGVLPQDVYEIPITNQWVVKELGDTLEIRTERAIYTIKPKVE
jgi:hypothetical protein